jgi:hypothetical protein
MVNRRGFSILTRDNRLLRKLRLLQNVTRKNSAVADKNTAPVTLKTR